MTTKIDNEKLYQSVLNLLDITKNIVTVQKILADNYDVSYKEMEQMISNVLLERSRKRQIRGDFRSLRNFTDEPTIGE
jgi:hypothetical protein